MGIEYRDHAQDRGYAAAPAICPVCREKREPLAAGMVKESQKSPSADLELELSGLRRLVVELLEKNQRLRERLQLASDREQGRPAVT
ncbi:hypothetical protein [Acidisarcina polymorpha]|nr:hypothetical protein [Acidisarcina polymorpha]